MTTVLPAELDPSASDLDAAPPRRVGCVGIAGAISLELVVAALVVGYAWFLWSWFVPAILHPDANGYWAQGSLLMETGRTWFWPESNTQYIGMHWLLGPNDVFLSRYPPGLAVVVGLVWRFFGWEASVLVNPVLAVLTLVGVYLIVRQIASAAWGIAAIIVLAANPSFTSHALTSISHIPVACCVVWGIWFLLRWSRTHRMAYIFVAGLVLGCIPTLRYADTVMGLGVLVFLIWHIRRPRVWRHYLAAAVGCAIPLVPLLVRNHLLLGAFWRTGYALTNEQTGFSMEYFQDNAIAYLQMLQGRGMGLLFGLGLIGSIWMICVRQMRATGLMLLLASTTMLLVYMAYYWARGVGDGDGMGNQIGGMRFLVPIIPLFAIAGMWALWQATRGAPVAARIALPLVVIGMQLLLGGSSLTDELRRSHDRKVPLALATRGLMEVTQPGDVVLTNPTLLQQLDFVRHWKLADASLMRGGAPGRRLARRATSPDGSANPSPMQAEKMELRAELYSGSTQERQRAFALDIDEWAGEQDVYIVGNEGELERLLPGVRRGDLTIVHRIPTPAPPQQSEQRRGGMQFGSRSRRGGGAGGGGFNRGFSPGEDIVIARWDPQ